MSEISFIERTEKTIQEFKDHNVKIRYPKLFEEHNALLKMQKEIDVIYTTLPIQYQDFFLSSVTLSTSLNLPLMQDVRLAQYYDVDYLQKDCTRLENEIASMKQDIECKRSCIESYTKNSESTSLSFHSVFSLVTEINYPQTTVHSDNGKVTALENQIDNLEKELAEERKKSKQPRLTSKSDRLTAAHFFYPFSVGE